MCSQPTRARIVASLFWLLGTSALPASANWAGRPLVALLDELRRDGLNLAYSSELVPPGALIAREPAGATVRDKVDAALTAAGLRLRELAPGRFVVELAARPVEPGADALDEVVITARRDATTPALTTSRVSLAHTPGGSEDAFASLRSLPGIAADTSARPIVRGSPQEDVLVIFDHVQLPDPFHQRNFSNLTSMFDPSVVDRIDLYTGAFPVRYGTRSGGVIELQPRTATARREPTIGASLAALRFTVAGSADEHGLQLLAAARSSLSTADLLSADRPASPPRTRDALGRVHWTAAGGRQWTAGLLALDDETQLAARNGIERVLTASRSQTAWLTEESQPGDSWQQRTTLVAAGSHNRRSGDTLRPGFMSGTLDDLRDLQEYTLDHESQFGHGANGRWIIGGELDRTSGNVDYERDLNFIVPVASTTGAQAQADAQVHTSLRSNYAAAYGSYLRHTGERSGLELGVRYDWQHYPGLRAFQEWSPRLNANLGLSRGFALHASVGKYTQAQRPEERRFEESQYTPDQPQVQWQETLGVDYRAAGGVRLRLDGYSKHWDRVSPYFDNLLNERGLLPELAPFRIRVAPRSSRAQGLEFNLQSAEQQPVNYWLNASWAVVQDLVGQNALARSWDQRAAVNAGLDFTQASFDGTAVVRWHGGTPLTAVMLGADANGLPRLVAGRRNGVRTRDFLSLDLRAAWTQQFGTQTLEYWLDVVNAFNRNGGCCVSLDSAALTTIGSAALNGNVQPRSVNIGVILRLNR